MKQFILYDVTQYAWFEIFSKKFREKHSEVYDIKFELSDIPEDEWASTINQTWSAGVCLQKLADMFSGQLVTNGSEFVLNTDLTFLVDGVKMLAESQGITICITDWKNYKFLNSETTQ